MKTWLLSALLLLAGLYAAAQCNNAPQLSISPQNDDLIYCPYDTVTLSTGSYDSYQWRYRFFGQSGTWKNFDGGTGSSIEVPISEWAATWFTVVTTEGGCTYSSDTILLDGWAFSPVTISSEAQNFFCRGDSTVIENGFGSYARYLWYRDGEPIAGADQASFVVRESGYYTLAAWPHECPELQLYSGLGPEFTFDGPEVPVIQFTDGQLTIKTGGTGMRQWLRNDQPISGATGTIYEPGETGEYRLQVTDANGCTAVSAPVSVVISGLREPEMPAVRLWPQPVDEILYFENQENGVLQLALYNAAGQLVWQADLPAQASGRFDMRSVPAGYYRAVVLDGRHRGLSQPLLIHR